MKTAGQAAKRLSLFRLFFERGQRFVIYIPFFQDAENRFAGKSGAHQLAEDARSLLAILGLLQTLLAKIVARLLFFADPFVSCVHGMLDHRGVHAASLQLRDHAATTDFLVVAPHGGIVSGVLRVVEISLFFETANDELDQRFAVLRSGLLDAGPPPAP